MKRRRTKIIAATFLVAVFLTILGAVLFFNILPKEKRVTSHIENAYSVDEEGFERSLLHLLGRPVLGGNRIEILRNGDEIFPAKLEAIAAARRSITIETYEFWGDDLPEMLSDALIERAAAGVPIHFIMDYVGSLQAKEDDLSRMEEAGIEIVRWRKPSWYRGSRFNHRTHRKLLIVDGEVAFTGGANLADPWLKPLEDGGMRDTHYRLIGPIVGELQAAFMDNWLKATGEVLLGGDYFPKLEPAGELRAQVVLSSPREGTHMIRKLYLLAIAGARENLRFSTAFFYVDPMFEEALIDASRRGVRVEILAPGEETEKMWVRYASRNRWGDLLDAGIAIYEYDGPMYHAKTLIVDDRFVSFGSANLDNRSFRINDEANVNVFDPGFARERIQSWNEDLARTTLYDKEKWAERSRWERVAGWAGNLIGPQL